MMKTTIRPQLLSALREQLLVGLGDAADRGLVLSSRGFGSAGLAVVAARDVLDRLDALSAIETAVLLLRFSVRSGGLSRTGASQLLGLPEFEVEQLELSALERLSPTPEFQS